MFPIGDENEPGHGLAWVAAGVVAGLLFRALPSASARASWR
jgi:hypothetical protein